MVSRQGHDILTLHFVARSLEPVSCGPIAPDTTSSTFTARQTFQPTATFASCPPLDVLLVPGGLGTFGTLPSGQIADTDDCVHFIRRVFPSLKYFFTVCTGTALAAKAGVLDGLKATTNKRRWKGVTELGKKTHWVANARWVVDGDASKVWTTSGVSAGADGMVAWVAHVFGENIADNACSAMEYTRVKDPTNDPFAKENGAQDVMPVE
jgi:transcriptional regulator GlxA family with amidase domain